MNHKSNKKGRKVNVESVTDSIAGYYAENGMKLIKRDEFKKGLWSIITIKNSGDSDKEFETIVTNHKIFKHEKVLIPLTVDEYNTKEDALEGHDYWKKLLKSNDLPHIVINVSTSLSAKILDGNYGTLWRRLVRNTA